MGHGDPNRIITLRDRFGSQSIPFRSQHNGQFFLRLKSGIPNGDGIITQCHGRCSEPQCLELLHSEIRPRLCFVAQKRPWNLKYSSHTDANRPAVQRITACRRQQHRIDIQCCRRTKHSADIGGIHNIFQYRYAARTGAHFFHRRKRSPPHGAQHASCQFEAGQLGKYIKGSRINRNFPAAGNDPPCFPFNMPVQSPLDFPQ